MRNGVSNIYMAIVANNDTVIKNAVDLYIKEGVKIADVTYGKGVFWRLVDISKYDFHPSDILTLPDSPCDFRNLPYENETFDLVVFDPPYAHNPGRMLVNNNYKNAETTKGFYHNDIIQLYYEGINEAKRILKYNGFLFVKCKDEIESSKQKMSHIEIHDYCTSNGFEVIDLFVVVQKVNPVVQFAQQHARKNHSYLWVFQKQD